MTGEFDPWRWQLSSPRTQNILFQPRLDALLSFVNRLTPLTLLWSPPLKPWGHLLTHVGLFLRDEVGAEVQKRTCCSLSAYCLLLHSTTDPFPRCCLCEWQPGEDCVMICPAYKAMDT